MTFRAYAPEAPDKLLSLETDLGPEPNLGAGYVASEELSNALNVALALGRPLLVSGEPGCGKTEFGYSVARRLGIPRVHFFATQSTSQARDLFYEYDAVGRFQSAQIAAFNHEAARAARTSARDHIRLSALGRAILDAHPGDAVKDLAAGDYKHPGAPRRSVVIIDEVDKAPRDFANDLLNNFERLTFRIPELAGECENPETPPGDNLSEALRPVIVLTSNAEKTLPDAFLRRCSFHHIEFPDRPALEAIALQWFARRASKRFGAPDPALSGLAANLVLEFRTFDLTKKPGTAELINFIAAMSAARSEAGEIGAWDGPSFRRYGLLARSTLAKSEDDAKALLVLLSRQGE